MFGKQVVVASRPLERAMMNMKLPRRAFLHLAAGAAALPAVSRITWAQAYPSRPVRIDVGFAAGSAPDIIARLIGQWLSERLDQPFVIENRPGAASNIASETVVKAPPDGYTLLLVTTANVINGTLYEKLNFDFARDVAPVAGISGNPFVMVVNPSFPAKTVPEFIAYAKANAGKVNMASAGNGSLSHVSGELFKMMAGVDLVHVPYPRGGALTDLVGGRVQVVFATVGESIEQISAGNLRALAVTSATRSLRLPEVPTVGDFVPGYQTGGWNGIGAPKGTPSEIINKLNTQINAALADANTKAKLASLSAAVLPLSPNEFGKLIAEETEKWDKVIRSANIKAE